MRKRLGYFDVARAFAIIAVIVSHTVPSDSLIHDLCFTFELPLFFPNQWLLFETRETSR